MTRIQSNSTSRLDGKRGSDESSPEPQRASRTNWIWLTVCVLVLATVGAVRVRLLDMPLERDEGEYAYGGQLLLEGVPPYVDLYTMKWPGTHAAYAVLMMLFGQSPSGIHVGLILITTATACLVYGLARRLMGEVAGATAASAYAVLAVSPSIHGLAAHATHFVMLPVMAAMVLLQGFDASSRPRRYMLIGLLLAVGALMKQPGLAFGLFGIAWIVALEFAEPIRKWDRLGKHLTWLAVGGALPFLVLAFSLAAAGSWHTFRLWTVDYARAYGALTTPMQGLRELWRSTAPNLLKASPGFWGLAAVGVAALAVVRTARRTRYFLLGFLLASVVAVCPGWYFRPHYFLLLAPAASLLVGRVFQGCSDRLESRPLRVTPTAVLAPVFVAMLAWSFWNMRAVLFELSPTLALQTIYGEEPFVESVAMANYIASHSRPEDRIAVLGSEPQLFFYSHRRSATGCVYMYPLMEPQPFAAAMQEGAVREIENAQPQFAVFVHYAQSWLSRTNSPTLLLDWFKGYGEENLDLVGWVEAVSLTNSEYHAASPGGGFQPRTQNWMALFVRRAGKTEEQSNK